MTGFLDNATIFSANSSFEVEKVVLGILALVAVTAGLIKFMTAEDKPKENKGRSHSYHYSGTLFKESRPTFSPMKSTETHVISLGDNLNITQKFHPETATLNPSYSAIFGQKGKSGAKPAFPKTDEMYSLALASQGLEQTPKDLKQSHGFNRIFQIEEKPKTGYEFVGYISPELREIRRKQEAELKSLHEFNERVRKGETGLSGPGSVARIGRSLHEPLSESARWWGTSSTLDSVMFREWHQPPSFSGVYVSIGAKAQIALGRRPGYNGG